MRHRRSTCFLFWAVLFHSVGPALATAQEAGLPPGTLVRLRVERGPGGSVSRYSGVLTVVGADSVILETRSGPVRLPLAAVVELEQRRMVRHTLEGMAIAGSVAGVAQAEVPVRLAAAAVGAGLGFLVRLPRWQQQPVAAVRPEVLPGTVIRVSRWERPVLEGVFLGAAGDSVDLAIGGERIRVARQDIRRIAWRSGRAPPSLIPPVLFGTMGAGLGYLLTRRDCSREWLCFDGIGAIPGAAVGLTLGTVVALTTRGWRWEGGEGAPRLGVRSLPDGRTLVAATWSF